jgi:hypothetical protein
MLPIRLQRQAELCPCQNHPWMAAPPTQSFQATVRLRVQNSIIRQFLFASINGPR